MWLYNVFFPKEKSRAEVSTEKNLLVALHRLNYDETASGRGKKVNN